MEQLENKKIDLETELRKLAERLNVKDLKETDLFPKYFELETYRGCNISCKMCTVNEWENSNMGMNQNLFDKIAEEMGQYSNWIERVTLSRDGEPTMDRYLPQRVERLKNEGINYVTFSTNATALTERRSLELINSGLDDIRFSIDGYTKETFEEIRDGAKFDMVIGNCLRFIDLRNKYGNKPTIQIRMVVQERNKHEEAQWREFWKQKISPQDTIYAKPMHSWGNQLQSYELHEEDGKYSGKPCISPWSTMAIHADGKVGLCGCDYNTVVPMGDLNRQNIKEIWKSEPYQKARQLHESGRRDEIKICIGCNIWDEEVKKVYRL